MFPHPADIREPNYTEQGQPRSGIGVSGVPGGPLTNEQLIAGLRPSDPPPQYGPMTPVQSAMLGEFPHSFPSPSPPAPQQYLPQYPPHGQQHPQQAPDVSGWRPELTLPESRQQAHHLVIEPLGRESQSQISLNRHDDHGRVATHDRYERLLGFVAGKLGRQQWQQVLQEFNGIF